LSLKQRINRLKREVAAAEDESRPIVVLLFGDPEVHRLLGRQMSSREGMIGSELFTAIDGESEGQFHRRLAKIARERIAGLGHKVTIVSVGDDEPVKECLYNLDGTLKTPVEGQAEPPGDATRH
jgi:hypothetical protein